MIWYITFAAVLLLLLISARLLFIKRLGSLRFSLVLILLLLVCTGYLVDGSFSPFLYFRF